MEIGANDEEMLGEKTNTILGRGALTEETM